MTCSMMPVVLAAALLAGHGAASQMAPAAVLIVANLTVKTGQVSHDDLRDSFTGVSSSFRDGSRVVPVLLKEGTVHNAFLSAYVGKSDGAFRASWRSLLFTGEGVLPRTFDSESALVEYVARTPGAIGYIARSTPHEGVKVLVVH